MKTVVIDKHMMLTMLDIFVEYGCTNIEDIKNMLNKDLESDDDVVFEYPYDFTEFEDKEDEENEINK